MAKLSNLLVPYSTRLTEEERRLYAKALAYNLLSLYANAKPVCMRRRLHPKKTKLGARHSPTTERHHFRFLLAQLCHPLAATTKRLAQACQVSRIARESRSTCIHTPSHALTHTHKNLTPNSNTEQVLTMINYKR